MSQEDEVRNASEQFYAALNRMLNGDAGPLSEIWSHSATVTTMHPIGGRDAGWDTVRKTWEEVARLASDGKVEITDQMIQASGDMAYELGVERGRTKFGGEEIRIEQRVTNIYRREAGAWKIVHHHADLSASMKELVGRLVAGKKASS